MRAPITPAASTAPASSSSELGKGAAGPESSKLSRLVGVVPSPGVQETGDTLPYRLLVLVHNKLPSAAAASHGCRTFPSPASHLAGPNPA